MSHAALERMIARQEALSAALDGHDVAALERAASALNTAVQEVAASGGWHAGAELRGRLRLSLQLADAAKARINYLADRTRRRLDRLAALTGEPRTQAYGRTGRLR